MGRGSLSALATLVDRSSRCICPGRSAKTVCETPIATLSELPHTVRLTLTWDHGAEMAYHEHRGPVRPSVARTVPLRWPVSRRRKSG